MVTPTALSSETIQTTVEQYFAASRSDNKVENMTACFAHDSINYDPAEGPALQGHDELRQFFQNIADLFAMIELWEEFISINGSEAAVKWRGNGLGKNGVSVAFEGIDLIEFNADGKIQSMRAYWNPSSMLETLLGA